MDAELDIRSLSVTSSAGRAEPAVFKASHDDLYAYGPDFRFVD